MRKLQEILEAEDNYEFLNARSTGRPQTLMKVKYFTGYLRQSLKGGGWVEPYPEKSVISMHMTKISILQRLE